MTDGTPEDELVEDAEPELHQTHDPEEYDAEGDSAVSGATGTVYAGPDGDREPAATPQDDAPDEDDAGGAG